MSLKGEEGTLI